MPSSKFKVAGSVYAILSSCACVRGLQILSDIVEEGAQTSAVRSVSDPPSEHDEEQIWETFSECMSGRDLDPAIWEDRAKLMADFMRAQGDEVTELSKDAGVIAIVRDRVLNWRCDIIIRIPQDIKLFDWAPASLQVPNDLRPLHRFKNHEDDRIRQVSFDGDNFECVDDFAMFMQKLQQAATDQKPKCWIRFWGPNESFEHLWLFKQTRMIFVNVSRELSRKNKSKGTSAAQVVVVAECRTREALRRFIQNGNPDQQTRAQAALDVLGEEWNPSLLPAGAKYEYYLESFRQQKGKQSASELSDDQRCEFSDSLYLNTIDDSGSMRLHNHMASVAKYNAETKIISDAFIQIHKLTGKSPAEKIYNRILLRVQPALAQPLSDQEVGLMAQLLDEHFYDFHDYLTTLRSQGDVTATKILAIPDVKNYQMLCQMVERVLANPELVEKEDSVKILEGIDATANLDVKEIIKSYLWGRRKQCSDAQIYSKINLINRRF